jgi:energy-coupling factor transporter ATP-binding protein EcfA2
MPVRHDTLAQVRQKVGLVFQDSDNQLFMPTVMEDVAFGPLNLGLDREMAQTRAREALAAVGMAHASAKAPYHLSAGEKKRVAIAGILAMSPEILVLDEPTTFLDPPGQNALLELLDQLPQAKILVTHEVDCASAWQPGYLFRERQDRWRGARRRSRGAFSLGSNRTGPHGQQPALTRSSGQLTSGPSHRQGEHKPLPLASAQ